MKKSLLIKYEGEELVIELDGKSIFNLENIDNYDNVYQYLSGLLFGIFQSRLSRVGVGEAHLSRRANAAITKHGDSVGIILPNNAIFEHMAKYILENKFEIKTIEEFDYGVNKGYVANIVD